ncbi:unnamed protein product [Haemonchus placei]|uniref:BTB domain-containing protein n=1 Tax=Haemonchus placei TaxID=6290 RepID=A0A0N4W5E6_HAEPC|nr:unnamed protein product [Haemonchus placei]
MEEKTGEQAKLSSHLSVILTLDLYPIYLFLLLNSFPQAKVQHVLVIGGDKLLINFSNILPQTKAVGNIQEYRGSSEEDTNILLRAQLFDTAVLPALTYYASKTCTIRKQDEHAVSSIQRAVEKTMLGTPPHTQVQKGILSSELRQRAKVRDAVANAKRSKISRAEHVTRYRDVPVGLGRLRTGYLGTSNEQEDDRQPDGQTCLGELRTNGMFCLVTLDPPVYSGSDRDE